MGVGIKSSRGSGSSGYVQKNLSSVGDKHKYDEFQESQRKRKAEKAEDDRKKRSSRDKIIQETSDDLQKYKSKREIELKCMKLRLKLEDDNTDEDEIIKQVDELRKQLIKGKKQEVIGKLDEKDPEHKVELQNAQNADNIPKANVYQYTPLNRERSKE